MHRFWGPVARTESPQPSPGWSSRGDRRASGWRRPLWNAALAGLGLLSSLGSLPAAAPTPAPAKAPAPPPAPAPTKGPADDSRGKADPPRGPQKPPAYQVELTAVRAIDGSNSGATAGRGAAGQPLKRIVPAAYPGDGSGTEIVKSPGRANPRTISNLVVAQGTTSIPSARQLTDTVWAWGQFIDHDLDLTVTTSAAGTADIPITNPVDLLAPGPIPFDRSSFIAGTGTAGVPRQHVNALTSFIDGSQVYGSDAATALSLRTLQGGLLKTSAGDLLPTGATGGFLAGDVRVTENVALISLQTLFVREHNRLARIVAVLAPAATDEEIYQVVRKIVGAEIQTITYREFLPALMGPTAPSLQLGEGTASGDPSVATEFSTALYRVGHTMLSPAIGLAERGAVVGTLPLRDAFFRTDFLTQDPANLDRILGGLTLRVSQEIDTRIVDDVRSFLFGPPGAGGLDLASLNIQRGRDHGLPDYNAMRVGYGLGPQGGFAGVTSQVAVQQGLETLYGTVDNIDPWVGALAEDHVAGSSLGPLLTVGLADQFRRSLAADRFALPRDRDLRQGLVQAVLPLDQVTFSQLVRRNTTIAALPRDPFRASGLETTDVRAIVDPKTGRLHLIGNRQANRLTLVDSPLGLVCMGLSGTLINGSSVQLLETGRNPSVTIDLGEGDDAVTFVGGAYREACLVLGAGNDTITSVLTTFEVKLSDE